MTTNILEMRGITKTFPGVKALSNVTLGVERGDVRRRGEADLAHRGGEKCDEEVDVHHEHQVDHRRDVEMGIFRGAAADGEAE